MPQRRTPPPDRHREPRPAATDRDAEPETEAGLRHGAEPEHVAELERRLVELELRYMEQMVAVETLDEIVRDQDRRLDRLEARLTRLEQAGDQDDDDIFGELG